MSHFLPRGWIGGVLSALCLTGCVPQLGNPPTASEIAADPPEGKEEVLAAAEELEEKAREEREKGKLKPSIAHYQRAADLLRTLGKDLSEEEAEAMARIQYDLACGLAVSGQTEPALAALKEAVTAGWDDFGHAETDADLDSLRKLPAYREILTLGRELGLKRLHEKLAAFKPFEIDFSLPDLDGKTLSLADYRGKVLIVDFWATWCPPCRAEVPHFIRLYKERKADGLEIVGLSFEHATGDEAEEKVRKFMKTAGVNYRCAEGTDEVQDQVPDFSSLPTTLFFDRQGKVRLRLEGYHSYEKLSAAAAVLLEEK